MNDHRAFLQVTSGRLEGKRVWLEKGTVLRVGQSARADLALIHDERMAPLHFDVLWNGETCVFSGHRQIPFLLNGATIDNETTAGDGAFVVAGQTSFLLRIVKSDLRAGLPPPPPDTKPLTEELLAARQQALIALARETSLFAILDAARDRRVRALLQACTEKHESLFDGEKGQRLADVAPYLVEFSPASPLLDVLVNDAWGESWGVYLIGLRPFKEVRRRLRRSLMVQDEETNKNLYFRFYDPRVLRIFWPTCSTRQRSEMLGTEISAFLLEGLDAGVLRLAVNE